MKVRIILFLCSLALSVQRTAYTTAIQSVISEGQLSDHHYYNLRGQRVETPQRGLYIIGGRKVVIK